MTSVYLFVTVLLISNILVLLFFYNLAIGYKYRDSMTQLYNKKYLEKIVTKWIMQKKDFTICFFDIDHFKRLNDTYGHLAGDKGIIYLSKELQKYFRGSGIVARIGGDEFAGVFTGRLEDKHDEAFTRLKEQSYEYNKKIINFTVSIGVCQSDPELSYEKLFELADKKLYDCKDNRSMATHYVIGSMDSCV